MSLQLSVTTLVNEICIPQTLLRVALEPGDIRLRKKEECHICSLKYVYHQEEPA